MVATAAQPGGQLIAAAPHHRLVAKGVASVAGCGLWADEEAIRDDDGAPDVKGSTAAPSGREDPFLAKHHHPRFVDR